MLHGDDKGRMMSMNNWWKSFFPLEGGNLSSRAKMILITVALIGVIALMWPVDKTKTVSAPASVTTASSALPTTDLEKKLAAVLSSIKGAGQVELTLFYASSGSKEYAVDRNEEVRETNETGEGGVKRVIRESRISQQLAGNSGEAFMVNAHSPEVVGALVVADGAGDPQVKEELSEALSSLLDLPLHRITVLPRE